MSSFQPSVSPEPVAIIGIGCRYPGGADTPDAFWQMIRNGVDSVTEVPKSRWDADAIYDPDVHVPNKTNTRWGGFLEQVDQFDPQFFGIAPREVATMDPQQRLLLEVTWEALEDAGQIPEQLRGSKTGVFVGIGTHDYSIMLWQQPVNDPYATTGTGNCIAANRISYLFDFKGPSLAVDTACSSSSVAIHLACQSLWTGESEMAVAGGVNVLLLPTVTAGFSKGGFMSPEGRCKSFDASADGYVRSEGSGMVVLKPLREAIADKDPIYAVIRGSAINQDGFSQGMAAPNAQAQAAVLKAAYEQARVNPADVRYVEAHGTGTKLGDPVEAQALGAVLAEGRKDACVIGSVKTNIGHTETAAGVAGVIKAALMLKHGEIPPSLHFHRANPAIDFEALKLRVETGIEPLSVGSIPTYIGVNSFGFGGTNAHAVLSNFHIGEDLVEQGDSVDDSAQLFAVSAKSEKALKALVERYKALLQEQPQIDLGALCTAVGARRSHFSYRLAFVAKSVAQLQEKIRSWLIEEGAKGAANNGKTADGVAFLFTGQGSQYVGMGRELDRTQPVFREALNQCAWILEQYGVPLLEVIFEGDLDIDRTVYTQPVLFSFEYALSQLWISWGVCPSVVLGHSLGEYVAACLAGVFSLEDALKLVAARGRLMQALPSGGAMVSVMASVKECVALAGETVSIAAVNGPQSTVLSGEEKAVSQIIQQLEQQNIKCKPLTVSHAFHSALMEPMLEDFREVASSIAFHEPQLPLISMLTGEVAAAEIATADYWVRHVRSPVLFLNAINTLNQREERTFLEIGAKPILLGMGRACLPNANDISWLPSLRPSQPDKVEMLTSLAALYMQGAAIDWANVAPNAKRTEISLPTYPFQRQCYWWEAARIPSMEPKSSISEAAVEVSAHPLIGNRLRLAGTDEQRFQVQLNAQSPDYLADHCVLEKVVLPGAAYLEMAIAAARLWQKTDTVTLSQVSIEQPLILNKPADIQLVLTPNGEHGGVEIFSLNSENRDGFTRHAIATTAGNPVETTYYLKDVQTTLQPYAVDVDTYYQKLSAQGLNYGAGFQVIQQLWHRKDQALSKLGRDSAIDTRYSLHPALLDGCLQTIGAAVGSDLSEGTYLPVGLEQLQFYRPLRQSGWCSVQLQRSDLNGNSDRSTQLKADLFIWDESGDLAARITGMTLRYVNRSALHQIFGVSKQPATTNDWLYDFAWRAQPKKEIEPSSKQLPAWLIFADEQGIGEQIAIALREKGDRCFFVQKGEYYQASPEADLYSLEATTPEAFTQLLTDLSLTLITEQQGDLSCRMLYLWALDADERTLGQLDEQVQVCGEFLSLVQAIAQFPALSTRLWLTTQAAQAVDGPSALNLQQTPLWGLARTLRLEQPDLHCTAIDLGETFSFGLSSKCLELLLDDLCNPDTEEQIAYRQETRLVARLLSHSDYRAVKPLEVPDSDSFRLGLSSYGVFDHLTLVPAKRRFYPGESTPQTGEIEIQVKASGLNFRDVLNALGMLQPVAESMGFATSAEVPFGGECAGIVTAVGLEVTTVKVGDAVIAAQAMGSLSQFIIAPEAFVIKKPPTMSFADAATIPTTFLTAYYGLVHCAKLKQGDRILIHAAAGGVGQAVLQMAQQIGAEVFATASEPKWSFLRAMGVQHVSNSRSLDFAGEILEWTGGKGVDVIFNSLNGDVISKNLEVLAPKGRFVEIGKIGIWTNEQMQAERPDVSYFPFDLLDISDAQPQAIADMLSDLMTQFQSKQLQPLPKTVFPIELAPDAFRYMAQSRHIGKVVLTLPEIAPRQAMVNADATYLITGGLGALGLKVAEWLASEGARYLVLLGRRSPTAVAQATIHKLEQSGVTVQIAQADIADASSLKKVLSSLSSSSEHPLRGVFHLAGTLEDSLLTHQSSESFKAVMTPKVAGAWNLHRLTQNLPLDHFVCFSSIVSVMGALGQSNYAAANAFLDGLAHHRRGLGLPALSLNWGPWADAGMVAQLDERSQRRMQDQGLTPIEPDIGLTLLKEMMQQSRTQVGVIPIDWATFMASASGQANGAQSSFLDAVRPATEPVKAAFKAEVLQQLSKVNVGDRPALLATYIQAQLAKVMGFSTPDAIDLNVQFGDLGMDSLMAVEFSNRLQTNLSHPVPQTLAFDYPTVNALSKYLAGKISPATDDEKISGSENNLKTALTQPRESMSSHAKVQEKAHSLKTAPKQPKNAHLKTSPPSQKNISSPTYTPPSEHYQFSRLPDYQRLQQDLERLDGLKNPFFAVHDGTAKDTTDIAGRSLINYASYNYLGLSGEPRVIAAAQEAIAQYGTSVSASRIVSGERPVHLDLEKAIAQFLGTEDCITFIGGHATNVTTIGHLFQEKDLILCDALSHNSVREGCKLSGATIIDFPHNDYLALDSLLHEHRRNYEKVLITVEGVYSTDGDLAPLPEFVRLKKAHKVFLLVDEAHSIGVLGASGRGAGEHHGTAAGDVDMWMGTLSKSFASCGGYIAGCSELIKYLKYTAPGFVFSVGMAPANAAAALASLQVLKQEPNRVALVQARSRLFLSLAKAQGLNTGDSHDSPVIPIIVGEPHKAVQLTHTLFQQGINVQPMVYPSVPYNSARLRFFLSCLHTEEQIRKTVQTIADELLVINAATV